MKIDRKIVALLLVVLCVLGCIAAVPTLFKGNTEYKAALNDARNYAEKSLCTLSIQSYQKALAEEDTIELELELAEVYQKGLEDGELSKSQVAAFYEALIDNFKREPKAYDRALGYYLSIEDYETLSSIIVQANKLEIKSDGITTAINVLKTKYKAEYSGLPEAKRSLQGTYIVKDDEHYYIYNEKIQAQTGDVYDYASPFTDGKALVKKNGYTFLVNGSGIREAYFDNEITESTGVGCELIGCKSGDIYSYYNLAGEKVFGEYLFAGRFFDNLAAVQTAEGWQVIDNTGKVVSPQSYEDIKLGLSYECCPGGIIFAKENGKYKMFDKSMNRVGSAEFDDCDAFLSADWLAAVKAGEKWGFVSSKGETVIEPKYDTAKSFSNGLAAVTEGEACSFINVNDEKIITGTFLEGGYFSAAGKCLVRNQTFWQPIERYYTGM